MWNNVFIQDENIICREIAGELIIVPVRGNLADMETIFSIEGSAGQIWQQLDGNNSLADIRDSMLETFDVEEETINSDIVEFVDEIYNAGLVRLVKQ